ncbi:capsular biosynthesis protein [Ureibacillus sinduriensis BLB-1 = JCM 15800]|uniref:Tyrosine-protein phosphatase n=2 Tax=Ureibacillus sinduriensis TaxID=561440 RepID=A0A0A3HUJ3_9BACL|nr:capsular biosynthesis protein [Ureibacillus sinduriensis BLB-1 = JCM 15800]
MIDMHSHILWKVDDGPSTKEESLALLEQAAKEGITDVISTSHSQHPQYDADYGVVLEKITELQKELNRRQIPIVLHSGHEVRLTEKLVTAIQEGRIHLLADSKYLLLELPSSHIPNYTKKMIHALLMEGITPIIAHPERNKGVAEKPERLERLIREGALAQITAGSLAGHFGKSVQQLSLNLVRANLVHTYGSDVHNQTTRPLLFESGLRFLEKKKEFEAIEMLLHNNKMIVEKKSFVLFEPEIVQPRRWWSLL